MTGSLVLGRLRRDLMVLASVEGGASPSAQDIAEQAVKEGRAAETWVISFSDYFSESNVPWGNVDTHSVGVVSPSDKPASVPPLNPDAGEQESLDVPKNVSFTSPREEQAKAVAEQQASGELVDTGTKPDGTPTGTSHFSEKAVDQGRVVLDKSKSK